MPAFRLFCLDKNKHITGRSDFDAVDDEAAIAFVRANFPDSDCEIWELGRLVARVPSDGEVQFSDAN